MTPARRSDQQPQLVPIRRAPSGESGPELAWPTALRALMLLSEAAQPADLMLTRLSDESLAQLRASLVRLNDDEPTSAA